MFDFIKRKFREAIIDPISDSVREKQEQLAETASEYAAPSVFYLLFAITGAVAVILVLLSLSLYIGQLLGSYLYGLFIFTSFFILLFLFVWAMRSCIETALDSYFKCNTMVPVVGTDSRIKHLAFRSQVFFLAGGSTHLQSCVSPDH